MMHKLNMQQKKIIGDYKKDGMYPTDKIIKGFYGWRDVMIISFCPNKNRTRTKQLDKHYKHLEEAHLSGAHLTDFIKKRMTAKEAEEYYRKYKKNSDPEIIKEMILYLEIIKWEIGKEKLKKIFLMGRNAEELFSKYLEKDIKEELKDVKLVYIPHFTCLRHEDDIKDYKKKLKFN